MHKLRGTLSSNISVMLKVSGCMNIVIKSYFFLERVMKLDRTYLNKCWKTYQELFDVCWPNPDQFFSKTYFAGTVKLFQIHS